MSSSRHPPQTRAYSCIGGCRHLTGTLLHRVKAGPFRPRDMTASTDTTLARALGGGPATASHWFPNIDKWFHPQGS